VLLAGMAFALLALTVWHTHGPTAWEQPIITVAKRAPLPLHDFWIAMFDAIPFTLITLALVFAAAARGRTSLAVSGLTGCLVAVVSAEMVFKPLVGRVRLHSVGLQHHVVNLGGPMFPSAHVTAAAAWATFAWLILDRRSRLRPFLVALPLVIGWAVIAKQMHYPADVLGGLIIGPTAVYFTVGVVRAAAHWSERPDAVLDLEPTPDDRVKTLV
jgi:membrane-associated phospholipid phosphatase